ncbi:MAG: hypothetical protein DRP56_06220 [Planctomycetota bacterium]|nr:MAG: hypothetical protein DRP56_06220 [Planctomycetota bacterium]
MEFESGGKTFVIRSLKRKEVKALKNEGFNLYNISADQLDDLIDRIFEIVLTEEEIGAAEDLDNRDAVKIFNQIFRETFGSEKQEKN